jgi:hypothetical protein
LINKEKSARRDKVFHEYVFLFNQNKKKKKTQIVLFRSVHSHFVATRNTVYKYTHKQTKKRKRLFINYDQKRKRDFIERKLSSIDESRDELRANLGNEDFRDGTKRRRDNGG